MKIQEAYNAGLLDFELYKIIPQTCAYCGYDIEINESLTFMWCSNSFCPEHLAARIELMLKELGIEGFGRKLCRDLVIENNLAFPGQVFDLDVEDMPSHYTYEMQEKLYNEIHSKRTQPLWKIIKSLQYDGFSDRAKKVFGGYGDIGQFYTDLSEQGEELIADLLNMNLTPTTARIEQLLWDNFDEITKTTSLFNIPKVASTMLKVSITGGVSSVTMDDGSKYPNRDLFIDDMIAKYGDKVNIIKLARPTSDCDYFISDKKSSSSKYRQAEENNIPIVTAAEFVEILENL